MNYQPHAHSTGAVQEDVDKKDDDQADQEPKMKVKDVSKLSFRKWKIQRTVLTKMEELKEGPLSILYQGFMEKRKVTVWTRSYKHIRGWCSGYILAFDRHMNLAMGDVIERYTNPIPISKKQRILRKKKAEKAALEEKTKEQAMYKALQEAKEGAMDIPQVDGGADGFTSDSDLECKVSAESLQEQRRKTNTTQFSSDRIEEKRRVPVQYSLDGEDCLTSDLKGIPIANDTRHKEHGLDRETDSVCSDLSADDIEEKNHASVLLQVDGAGGGTSDSEQDRKKDKLRTDRDRSRGRYQDRDRGTPGTDRDRSRGKDQDRDRGNDRDRSRGKDRARSSGRDRDRSRGNDQQRDQGRDRDKSRERERIERHRKQDAMRHDERRGKSTDRRQDMERDNSRYGRDIDSSASVNRSELDKERRARSMDRREDNKRDHPRYGIDSDSSDNRSVSDRDKRGEKPISRERSPELRDKRIAAEERRARYEAMGGLKIRNKRSEAMGKPSPSRHELDKERTGRQQQMNRDTLKQRDETPRYGRPNTKTRGTHVPASKGDGTGRYVSDEHESDWAAASENADKTLWKSMKTLSIENKEQEYEAVKSRHIPQLFIRGDNVVMVAFTENLEWNRI